MHITTIARLYRLAHKPKQLGWRNWLAIYLPRNNLGCLGVSLTPLFYADTYTDWGGSRCMYLRIYRLRLWVSRKGVRYGK